MSVTILVNDSPLAGLEGKKVTSTVIRERLMAEAEVNVAITFSENENKDAFEIGGRGELQLGVLVEQMRREGFELTVSRPNVLYKIDCDNNKLEPIEEVTIDVDKEFSSTVIDGMNQRKSEMIDMKSAEGDKVRLIFLAPSADFMSIISDFL
jgi:GTP-binding protein